MAAAKHLKSVSTAFAVAAQLFFVSAQARAVDGAAPSQDVYSRFLNDLDSCSALLPKTLEADASTKSVACSKSSSYKSCGYTLTTNERLATKIEITLGIDPDKIIARFITTNDDILSFMTQADGTLMGALLGAGTASKDVRPPESLGNLRDLPQRDRDFANNLIEYGLAHPCRLEAN